MHGKARSKVTVPPRCIPGYNTPRQDGYLFQSIMILSLYKDLSVPSGVLMLQPTAGILRLDFTLSLGENTSLGRDTHRPLRVHSQDEQSVSSRK